MCVLSTVATDGLVLKHQAISVHSVGPNIHCFAPGLDEKIDW